MELIELWRDTAVRDGFENGWTLSEISAETGLSVREVLRRKVDLNLVPARRSAVGAAGTGPEDPTTPALSR